MSQRSPMIGPAIQKTRKNKKFTLEQLAARSGVSKSMLSQIERGEANPTFAVVWSLTRALDMDFSDLVGGTSAMSRIREIEVTSVMHTPVIGSADGLCRLKILSTPQLAGETEWYDVEIKPGGKLDSAPHAHGAFEHFTALTDGFSVSSGEKSVDLGRGETARYAADIPHSISNTGTSVAHGILILLYS